MITESLMGRNRLVLVAIKEALEEPLTLLMDGDAKAALEL